MSIKVINVATRGEIPLQISKFPGGEVHVRLEENAVQNLTEVNVWAFIQNSDDIMALLLVTDAIRKAGQATTGVSETKIHLSLPYVPYARQDRVMTPGESLSIEVFCNLINSQNYSSVFIWDPHSDVTPALLKRVAVMPQEKLLSSDLGLILGPPELDKYQSLPRHEARVQARKDQLENIVLVSPDAGANKKIFKVAKECGFKHVVRADKERNVETGQITGTVVYSDHVGDKDFLIVDDICDRGRTFIELGKMLRPLTNGKIILYVTHAILPDGVKALKGYVDEMYCAHSFEKYPEGVNLMEINE
jgi:ribose-phosphate pyrophosphokinase